MVENPSGNWDGIRARFLRDLQDRNHNVLENRDALHAHPASAIDGVASTAATTVVTEQTIGQAPVVGALNSYAREDHTHGTPPAPALSQLSDVVIAAPATDQILRFNGVKWANGAQIAVQPGPGGIFYLDSTEVIPAGVGPQTKEMETLLKTPSVAVEVDETQVVNNSTLLIDQYMYNTALGVANIDAGEWTFDVYTYVDDATDTSELISAVYKVVVGTGTITITGVGTSRTATVVGGTPFDAFDFHINFIYTSRIITPNAVLVVTGVTDDHTLTVECLVTYTNEAGVAYSVDRYLLQSSTGDLNNLSVSLITNITVQPAFPINTTDKLVTRFFARTNHVGPITVHLVHNGTQHYTHFHTPLSIKHNDLAGLQGGTANEDFHLTSAEYIGVGTGVFVRQTALPGAAPPNPMQLLSEQIVGAATTTVTFTGLNINTDRKYILDVLIKTNTATNVSYKIFINNDTTAGNYQTVLISVTAANVISNGYANTQILELDASGGASSGSANINIELGPDGIFRCISHCNELIAPTAAVKLEIYSVSSRVTFANITRIDITASGANQIGAGSIFRLYRVSPI